MDLEATDRRLMEFLHLHKETGRQFFQSCGLASGHPLPLFFIRSNPGITQGELAGLLNLTPATMAVSVRRMESAGLLNRERDDSDRRVFHLYLTPQGERIDDACRKGKEFFVNTLYRGLTEAEITAFENVLKKMRANLEDACRTMETDTTEREDKR